MALTQPALDSVLTIIIRIDLFTVAYFAHITQKQRNIQSRNASIIHLHGQSIKEHSLSKERYHMGCLTIEPLTPNRPEFPLQPKALVAVLRI